MARYIKTKDGKFAGSIGAGKTTVPTAAPPRPAPASVSTPTLAAIPTPNVLTAVPEYCFDPHTTDDTTSSSLQAPPGRPDVETRATWPSTRAQSELEEEFLHGEDGIFTALSTPPNSFAHFTKMQEIFATTSTRASALRSEGKHHQAAAVEWVGGVAHSLNHDFYDIYEDSTWSRDNDGVEFGSGENPTIHFRDVNSDFAVILHPDGDVTEDKDWNEDTPTRTNDGVESGSGENPAIHSRDINSDWVIPVDTMRKDAREMFTGAVIMDYLHLTNGDVEAAAVYASLTD